MQTYMEYIRKAIIETVSEVTSAPTLEYIYSMVMAAHVAETSQEDD